MKKILVVDDEVEILEFISKILARNKYIPVVASTAQQALSLVQTELPDLILLDINMPDMDGMDILKEFKKSDKSKNIPVVMITARDAQFDRDYCFELGAYDYITKPCDAQLILHQIAKVLEKSNA